jgi:integrase
MPRFSYRSDAGQPAIPKYRLHRASGQAVVTIAGKDNYLGRWKSRASRAEYDRLIGEWLVQGRPTVPSARQYADFTVVELIAAYWRHAKTYYVKNGQPTGELPGLKVALRFLKKYYGHTAAAMFGPLALQAIQLRMIEAGHSRKYINNNIGPIKRAFRWAVSKELVPAHVHQALLSVEGLKKGRTEAREPDPIMPLPDEVLEATLPHLPEPVRSMVRLQRLCGCRPGEIVLLRPCDLDMTQSVWRYTTESHKTEHHGKARCIFIGPRGQEILRPFLLRPADEYCFQTKRRGKTPGGRYTKNNYHRAIKLACEKAGLKPWAPNRLRHSAATEIRAGFDLESAQAILGHSSLKMSEHYAGPQRFSERNLRTGTSNLALVRRRGS